MLRVNVGKLRYLSAGDTRQSYGHTSNLKISENIFLKCKVVLKNEWTFQRNFKYIFFEIIIHSVKYIIMRESKN